MDQPIYHLRLLLSNNHEINVFGHKDEFSHVMTAYAETLNWSENDKIEVAGFTDSADRAPIKVVVKAESVVGMVLFLEY